MSPAKQKRFRRLFEEDVDLGQLSDPELKQLIAEKLTIFRAEGDSIDHKRAKLRLKMKYALKELPPHLKEEFDELVKERSMVIVRDGVTSQKRGWDGNTEDIYYRRFCQFFGWMHHSLRVPQENLSIAYLAFSQILHEYDLYLMNRKQEVGMERRWAMSTAEWYVFAASLTRRQLGLGSKFEGVEVPGGNEGFLRSRRALLEKLASIDIPRMTDEAAFENGQRDNIRPILTSAEMSEANRNWAKRLDETTMLYRYLGKSVRGETTASDSVRRVLPILRFENPLRAIEHGVWRLNRKILELRQGSFHWCTGIRESVAVKFHAQVPLRRQTFCGLTYHHDNTGMVFQERGRWWVKVPEDLFKNEKSQAFQDLVVDGCYVVTLEDEWGLYTDLERYIHEARDGVLSGVKSNAFYVTRHNEAHVGPGTFANLFRAFTENYVAENPGRKTGLQGVKSFGSHAMRHIVASAVFNRTQSLAAAAVAIHDSEKTTEKHYRKYFLDPKKRANVMRTVLGPEPDSPIWPKFGEILPRIASPSTAPQIRSPHESVEGVSSD